MHDRENEPLHTSLLISDEVVFNQSYLAIATAFLAEVRLVQQLLVLKHNQLRKCVHHVMLIITIGTSTRHCEGHH